MKRIPFLFRSPEKGAETSVYLASSPEVAGVSGRFFLRCHESRTKKITYDAEVAARLWRASEDLCAKFTRNSRAVRPQGQVVAHKLVEQMLGHAPQVSRPPLLHRGSRSLTRQKGISGRRRLERI
jgi:hypothetical protein